ncbi:MAG: hypothetical protein J7501_12705 [Bdellovibrio sp.]|nr:hypothetical protein [Bdellovibrio sp.]
MRKRTIVLPALALILGFSGMAFYKTQARNPASTSPRWVPQEYGKHLVPVKITLVPPAEIPVSNEEEVTLRGRINVSSSIDSDLAFSWTLPPGVSVVEGVLTDELPNVQAGQTVEVKIVVTGFSKEEQKYISLQASVMKGRLHLGASSVISSRPEDTWESIAPEMQKAAEETLGAEKFRKSRE